MINFGELTINGGQHTDEEIHAGCNAAYAVLQRADYTAEEAQRAFLGMCNGTCHWGRAAEAWMDAERAALKAAESGWAQPSEGATLALL